MSSIAKPLWDLIRHCLFCQQQLEPYKLAQKQIVDVFVWLDQRRRNFVDVSDFYSKFSDLEQAELFYIFKYLDYSRKGAINCDDLLRVVGSKSPNLSAADPVRNFTNFVKVLKASFHLAEEQKRKLGITNELLQSIFARATLNKKDKVGLKELIVLFKESDLDVDDDFVIYLQQSVFSKITGLTFAEFCQIFGPFEWETQVSKPQQRPQRPQYQNYAFMEQPGLKAASYLETKTNERIKNSEKLNSEIDKILEKYRSPSKVATASSYEPARDVSPYRNTKYTYSDAVQEKPQKPYSKYTDFKAEIYDYKSPDRFEKQRPSKLYEQLEKKKTEQGLINYVSSPIDPHSEINKRREELRRGSLQRQKIIDNLMNKKKKFEPQQPQFSRTASTMAPFYASLKIQRPQPAQQSRPLTYQGYRPSTPTQKVSRVQAQQNFKQRTNIGRFYETTTVSQKPQPVRPASASKTGSGYLQRSVYGRLTGFDTSSKPELSQFYKRSSQDLQNSGYEKENILKKAEEEATKKIEEIQRRARLKVMEKRSAAGVYNRWLK